MKRKPSPIVPAIAVAAVGTALAIGFTERSTNPPKYQRVVIVRAVDGDTLAVQGKSSFKVRLLGVDTPETHKPGTPVQCYGPEAAAYTARVAAGQRATVTTEPSSGDTVDRYGRTLAYVTFSHRDLGAMLLRGGFAKVYAYRNRHFAKRARYETLQARAQAAHAGRWGKC